MPGTIDSEECPDGITNLIGVIEGSDPFLKDEYIMLSAWVDVACAYHQKAIPIISYISCYTKPI